MTGPTFHRRQILAGALALAGTGVGPAVAMTAIHTDLVAAGQARLIGATPFGMPEVVSKPSTEPDVSLLGVAGGRGEISADAELGIRFEAMPGLETGIQIWRYAPWKAWTRPLAIRSPADLRADDVQLLFWRETDGTVMAAVPLSGAGFRTTIGQIDGQLAIRSVAGAATSAPRTLPLLAVGHGRDPHAVIAATYRAALDAMDRSENEASRKVLPEPLTYLGWCSWNASELGNKLDETLVRNAAAEFRAAGVALGWILFDDGYFDHREQRLRGFGPNPAKFPRGFGPIVAELKRDFGIRYVGAWLALDGYWHGIDPDSPLGAEYADDLFTWTERSDPANPASPSRTNWFIRPERPALSRFYDAQYAALKDAGIDFAKVDNQLVVERMARGSFPIWTMAEAMHGAKNRAARRHFDNAVINCMDLTADAYFNLGATPVARAVEDYFPYKTDETYDLEKGNAAAHVLQALYNALYVGQMALPDFDMFETTHPNARLHAVARAANCGPIYVTDLPGQHDVALLKAMTLSDGRSLRADAPLLPCIDSLFQLQEARPFKAFSRVGDTGLLAVFNLADSDPVSGAFTAGDVPGYERGETIAYEHLSGRLLRLAEGARAPVTLPRFGCELWSLHRASEGTAIFGRSDKLNGLATVASVERRPGRRLVHLHELGPMAAWCADRPKAVTIEGLPVAYDWNAGLLTVAAPETGATGAVIIETDDA